MPDENRQPILIFHLVPCTEISPEFFDDFMTVNDEISKV